MQYILSSLWIGLELLCCLVFVSAFQTPKRNRIVCIIAFLLSWITMSFYSNTDINEVVKQFVTLALFTGLCAFLYNGKIISHFFLIIICYILLILIDTACAYGVCALLGVTFDEFVWLKFTYITVTTIGKLLSLFIVWLLKRVRSSNGMNGIQSKWFLLLLLFPTASVLILVLVFFGNQGNQDMSINAVIISAILAVANFAILYIVNAIEKASRIENETKILKQQIAFQADNYLALQKSYSLQRKATHEFERHLQTISDLLNRMDIQTAVDYLNRLQSNRTLRIYSVNSNHPVIDVILNQKHQLAKERGINIQIQVNDLSEVAIPTDSLVVLLSNLLDNAIEACQKLDSRKEIHCSILHDDGVYISVRNTSLPVKVKDKFIPTTKENASEHGYGLPAICYILEQLHAEYTFEYNDGWFQFVAEIPK